MVAVSAEARFDEQINWTDLFLLYAAWWRRLCAAVRPKGFSWIDHLGVRTLGAVRIW